MRGCRSLFFLVPSVMLLSACGAQHSSVFRTYEVQERKGAPETDTAVIDAKQRAIVATSAQRAVFSDRSRYRDAFVCAEPSPDALSAISSTFSGSLGGVFGPSEKVEAALASGFQEAASQLGLRNATIQLLRDGLYRQCEAYMNGLIDRAYYEQIANKYVNAMVTLLAVEQLTPRSAKSVKINSAEGSTVNADTKINVTSPTPKNPNQAEPAAGQPAAGQPAAGQPPAGQPPAGQPPAGQPAAGQPAAGQPAAGEPAARAGGETREDTATSGASAGPPVVNVNLPDNQGQIENHVSAAINTMVTWFLTKDTVDYCLRGLREGLSGEITVKANDEFQTAFVDVCKKVIVNQMTQQGELVGAAAFQISSGKFNPDACAFAIEKFWEPTAGNFDDDNERRIRDEMGKLGITMAISRFLDEPNLDDERRKVGTALGLSDCQ